MNLTRGRREPFPDCRHRGFGAHCHRCAQGRALQEKAQKFMAANIGTGQKDDKVLVELTKLETEAARLLKVDPRG